MTDPAFAIAVPLIARFEGFRSKPYQDTAGVWTIGYGATYLPNLARVTAATPPMSREAADAWLQVFVTKTLAAVRGMVHVSISDNQAAALCSLCYNEGTAAIRNSTLMLRLNAGHRAEAADGFLSWIYASGHPSDGLRVRRLAERAVFLTADAFGGTHQISAIPAGSGVKTTQEEITPESEADRLNARSLAGTFTPKPGSVA